MLEESCYRSYIPDDPQLKQMLLHDHHEAPAAAHAGVQRTWEGLRVHFYWPKMFKDILSYIAACRHCQLVKPVALPVAPLRTFPFPKKPF